MIEVIIAKSSAIGELPALSVQVSDAGYVGRISVAEGELIRHEIRFGARTQVQSKLKKRVAGCRVRVAGGQVPGESFLGPGALDFQYTISLSIILPRGSHAVNFPCTARYGLYHSLNQNYHFLKKLTQNVFILIVTTRSLPQKVYSLRKDTTCFKKPFFTWIWMPSSPRWRS